MVVLRCAASDDDNNKITKNNKNTKGLGVSDAIYTNNISRCLSLSVHTPKGELPTTQHTAVLLPNGTGLDWIWTGLVLVNHQPLPNPNEMNSVNFPFWTGWHHGTHFPGLYPSIQQRRVRGASRSLSFSLHHHLSRVLVSPAHIPLLILAFSVFILILPTGCSCPLRERECDCVTIIIVPWNMLVPAYAPTR